MSKEIIAHEGLTTFELIDIFVKLLGNPKHKTALMLWGQTGTGKSQMQRQILQQLAGESKTWKPGAKFQPSGALEVVGEWGLVDLRASLLEPTDLRGLPDLHKDVVRWVAPEELPLVGREDFFPEKGILFLDEFNHAQPAMQSACFSLVLDRRIGPHVLLPGWKIVAASNYSRENAFTYQMSDPLRNRFEHFHLRCSLDAFKRWAVSNDIDPKVVAFLNWNPDYLHKPNEAKEESFPTPRTWANADFTLKTFSNGHIVQVLESNLGPGATAVFKGFLDLFDQPELKIDITKMLKGSVKSPTFTTEKPDMAWAFTACITAHVRAKPELLEHAIEFYCTDAWKKATEIGRTGLADLRVAFGNKFQSAAEKHLSAITKRYAELINA
jgi:tRNA A37 threonylcarbamoyladenosine biosynthesis protein TsaE